MLAVATFAAAAASPIPCASTQGDDSRTALCESWCSEFVYEFGLAACSRRLVRIAA